MKLLRSNKNNAVETDPAFPSVPNRWMIITVNPVRREIPGYGEMTTLFLSFFLPASRTTASFFVFFLGFWASVRDVETFVSVRIINSAWIP